MYFRSRRPPPRRCTLALYYYYSAVCMNEETLSHGLVVSVPEYGTYGTLLLFLSVCFWNTVYDMICTVRCSLWSVFMPLMRGNHTRWFLSLVLQPLPVAVVLLLRNSLDRWWCSGAT